MIQKKTTLWKEQEQEYQDSLKRIADKVKKRQFRV